MEGKPLNPLVKRIMNEIIGGISKKEYYRKYAKNWRKNNPEKAKEKDRKDWIVKKEKIRLFREKNNIIIIKKEKLTEEERKERKRKSDRMYANGRRKIIRAQKRKNNIKFRLDSIFGSSISRVLSKRKAGRKWETLVGYTLDDLIKHLESKFEPWMSWNNYGKWHIDHIKPKSLFHYENPEDEEFKKCWALDNLQPLEAIENLKKSNKFLGDASQ